MLSNKITEDSTKIDIVKPCLANFKFGSTKNVTYDENAMDCEDSFVKDVNENRKDQPLKCNPGMIGKYTIHVIFFEFIINIINNLFVFFINILW